MRNGISASEIAETMVLAPGAEQVNFDKRHEFDLIVFYDRNSTRIGWKKDNQAVQGLYNALVHFDFDGENTARPPKLLEGGLEAWTSVMGDNSLATTGSSVARPSRRLEKTRPSLYPSGPRKTQMPEYIRNPEEARRWEETLKEPDAFTPITDVDGFLRRFPSVSATKESMASPEGLNRTGDGAYSSLSPSDSLPDLPSEPKRPQPTAARPSYSGLKEREEPEEMQRPGRLRPRRDKKTRNLVGLRNPNGAWCYANVTLQSLFWTPDFADELITGSWQKDYVIRAKHDETIPNPQLMIKMLSQLFQWMDKATIDPLEARTLQVSNALRCPALA
jgi:ubiquitin carboxyl-terminal hydrolase 8